MPFLTSDQLLEFCEYSFIERRWDSIQSILNIVLPDPNKIISVLAAEFNDVIIQTPRVVFSAQNDYESLLFHRKCLLLQLINRQICAVSEGLILRHDIQRQYNLAKQRASAIDRCVTAAYDIYKIDAEFFQKRFKATMVGGGIQLAAATTLAAVFSAVTPAVVVCSTYAGIDAGLMGYALYRRYWRAPRAKKTIHDDFPTIAFLLEPIISEARINIEVEDDLESGEDFSYQLLRDNKCSICWINSQEGVDSKLDVKDEVELKDNPLNRFYFTKIRGEAGDAFSGPYNGICIIEHEKQTQISQQEAEGKDEKQVTLKDPNTGSKGNALLATPRGRHFELFHISRAVTPSTPLTNSPTPVTTPVTTPTPVSNSVSPSTPANSVESDSESRSDLRVQL